MRRFILISAIALISLNLFAQEAQSAIDSLNVVLSERIESLETSVQKYRQETVNNVAKANQKISDLEAAVSEVDTKVQATEGAITQLEDSMSYKLSEATASYQKGHDTLSSSIDNRSLYGCIIAVAIVLFAAVVFIVLRRKILNGADAVELIRTAQKNLQEESLKLDNKLLELLDSQLKVQKESASDKHNGEIDHSLALKVADELTRIETNLSRMDPGVRGYKQLSASLRRIKDNYLANGYEIVDMLGMPYNDGMKVIANFVPDETLKEGEQIITGIVKPQINYKGVMIQAAQITVSQN